MRPVVAGVLQITGLTMMSIAAFFVSTALGLTVMGVGCVAVGLGLERG